MNPSMRAMHRLVKPHHHRTDDDDLALPIGKPDGRSIHEVLLAAGQFLQGQVDDGELREMDRKLADLNVRYAWQLEFMSSSEFKDVGITLGLKTAMLGALVYTPPAAPHDAQKSANTSAAGNPGIPEIPGIIRPNKIVPEDDGRSAPESGDPGLRSAADAGVSKIANADVQQFLLETPSKAPMNTLGTTLWPILLVPGDDRQHVQISTAFDLLAVVVSLLLPLPLAFVEKLDTPTDGNSFQWLEAGQVKNLLASLAFWLFLLSTMTFVWGALFNQIIGFAAPHELRATLVLNNYATGMIMFLAGFLLLSIVVLWNTLRTLGLTAFMIELFVSLAITIIYMGKVMGFVGEHMPLVLYHYPCWGRWYLHLYCPQHIKNIFPFSRLRANAEKQAQHLRTLLSRQEHEE